MNGKVDGIGIGSLGSLIDRDFFPSIINHHIGIEVLGFYILPQMYTTSVLLARTLLGP